MTDYVSYRRTCLGCDEESSMIRHTTEVPADMEFCPYCREYTFWAWCPAPSPDTVLPTLEIDEPPPGWKPKRGGMVAQQWVWAYRRIIRPMVLLMRAFEETPEPEDVCQTCGVCIPPQFDELATQIRRHLVEVGHMRKHPE